MDENPRPADNAGIDVPDDTAEEIPSVDPEVEKAIKVEAFHADLNRETRSTGFWMLVWGGLSLVASGIFDASWGVMLIVIGIASFFAGCCHAGGLCGHDGMGGCMEFPIQLP